EAGPPEVVVRRRGSRNAQSRDHAAGSFDRSVAFAEFSKIVAAGLLRLRSPMAPRVGRGDDAASCGRREAIIENGDGDYRIKLTGLIGDAVCGPMSPISPISSIR